jgi:tRNA 2-selenouridine synthase
MPDQFYLRLQESTVIALIMTVQTRMPRLIKEYSAYPKEELISSIKRISKRIGGDNTKEAINEVEANNFSRAIEITLNYYDKTYMYGLKERATGKIYYINTETDEIETNVSEILKVAKKIVF